MLSKAVVRRTLRQECRKGLSGVTSQAEKSQKGFFGSALETLMPRTEVNRSFLLISMILGMSLVGCANVSDAPPSASSTPTTALPSSPKTEAIEPPAQPLPQTAVSSAEESLPPTPPATHADQLSIRPGECWVLAVIHPKPVQKPLEIVVRDAVNDIEITPAIVETVNKEIIVREGGVTYRIVPPVYKRIKEKVMVRPEIRRSVVVPAVFEERDVVIEIEAEHTILEPCKVSTSSRSPGMPVQTLCSRRIPAKTKTITRKVLVQPETTREVVEPAVFKEVTRWVIETPARAVPVDIPPRTAKLRVQEITNPEHVDEQQLPPKIKRLIATRYEGEPGIVFRRAVCDHELTPKLVQTLQRALKHAGFDPGPVDGKFGKRTQQALLDYQRHNSLAHGALTYESLDHLGVTPE